MDFDGKFSILGGWEFGWQLSNWQEIQFQEKQDKT